MSQTPDLLSAAVLLTLLSPMLGCEPGPYGPPMVPSHHISEEGHLHAAGHDVPYLCLASDGRGRVKCPTGSPPPMAMRSCDSAGCHGSFTYEVDFPAGERVLDGDDAPGCWTCHQREWSSRKE